MGYRNLMIENPCKLSLKDEQLIIETSFTSRVPIEDINSMLIEHHQVTITACVLNKLTKSGVCVFICDEKHIPSGVLTGLNSHSRKLKIFENQISMTKPQLKRIWQEIIIQKIINQASVLKILDIEGYTELEALSKRVSSGDTTNVEATAAAFYFKRLFGDYFTRGDMIIINGALNYGYAILRGLIARTLVVYGFEPCVGICHHNQLNAFNLADDLIECYRPVIDLYVAENINSDEEVLTPEMKRELYNLINMDVISDGQYHTVSYAIERTVQSLSKIYLEKQGHIKCCEIIPLSLHEYE